MPTVRYNYNSEYENEELIKKKIKGVEVNYLKNLPQGGKIVGYTLFKKAKDKDEEIVNICGNSFSVKKRSSYDTVPIGYMNVGENDFIQIRKVNVIAFLIILLLLFFLGTAAYLKMNQLPPFDIKENDVPLADGKDIESIDPNEDINNIIDDINNDDDEKKKDIDYTSETELPRLSRVKVSGSKPEVILYNPSNNTVYMGFSVIVNGTEVYNSNGAVRPGQYVTWNAKNYFKKAGTYDAVFKITTFDVKTGEQCTGADMNSKITVK